MSVIIGVDPHKATHTAVALGQAEDELGRVQVRATRRQVAQLLVWAEPFEKRTWAIESAGGLGYLLAQQLVTAGEHVVDVPATLASRSAATATDRASLRSFLLDEPDASTRTRAPGLRSVAAADHAEILRLNADVKRLVPWRFRPRRAR
jgi:transposase